MKHNKTSSRLNEDPTHSEIGKCFTEICEYLDGVDTKLDNFVQAHKDICYEKLEDFLCLKGIQYDKTRSLLKDALEGSPKYKNKREINKLRQEVKRLGQELEAMKEQNEILRNENKKLRAQVMNAEEDNKLIKKKLSATLNEAATLRLNLEKACFKLESTVKLEEEKEILSNVVEKLKEVSRANKVSTMFDLLEANHPQETRSRTANGSRMKRTKTLCYPLQYSGKPPLLFQYSGAKIVPRKYSFQRVTSRNRTLHQIRTGVNNIND